MFCTGSENRAGNQKTMVPQFWWSILVAKDQRALNHSNRAITNCLIFKVTPKVLSQSLGACIQMESVSVWANQLKNFLHSIASRFESNMLKILPKMLSGISHLLCSSDVPIMLALCS